MPQANGTRRWGLPLAWGCAILILAGSPGAVRAERPGPDALRDRVKTLRPGSSSRDGRARAVASLPLDKMTPANRRRAAEIARGASLFREMPTLAFEVDPDAYAYFAEHPDVAVSLWRAMGISTFRMWQTGRDEFEADAGDGTIGTIEALYRGSDHRVILCEGEYNNSLLLKPIKARALIHLETGFSRDESGRCFATHRAALYVVFPSTAVETAAKIISPVSNLIIDHNFQEISLFLHMMSLAMARRPGWIEQMTTRLDGVLECRRGELLKVTARAYVAARQRAATGPDQAREARDQQPGQRR